LRLKRTVAPQAHCCASSALLRLKRTVAPQAHC